MSGDPEILILRYLRRIDDCLDRVADDVRELKIRITAVEENLASLNRRFDRLEGRIDRIERRVDEACEDLNEENRLKTGIWARCEECGEEHITGIQVHCPRCGKINVADNALYELRQVGIKE